MSHEGWLIVTAVLVALSCSLNGNLLVLRKQAMQGDAISHSVLLGLVVAFLLSGQRDLWLMFTGAVTAGLSSALLAEWMHRKMALRSQDSIGFTFTLFFAVATVLISSYADAVDIDQSCVLFGELAFTPLDVIHVGGQNFGPRVVWLTSISLLLSTVCFAVGWNRLKALSFDPLYSSASGIRIRYWQTLLTALLSVAAVSAFDAVGAIMVVAMLTIVPNTARRLVRSVEGMVACSAVLAAVSAVLGYWVATVLDASIAASMALTAGLMFFATVALKPRSNSFGG